VLSLVRGAVSYRHAACCTPGVLGRVLVQRMGLRHLLIGSACLSPGVRRRARLGPRTRAALIGTESDKLDKTEGGELPRTTR